MPAKLRKSPDGWAGAFAHVNYNSVPALARRRIFATHQAVVGLVAISFLCPKLRLLQLGIFVARFLSQLLIEW